jgi:hypothetical protein
VIDGRSIADLLLGKADQLEEQPFFYYFGVQLQALRLGRWKLFMKQTERPPYSRSLWYMQNPDLFERHHALRAEPELYDLETDIGESINVADDHVDVVARLTEMARRFDERMQREKRPPVYLEQSFTSP